MKIKKHPDYETEVKRLEETSLHIEHTITAVENYRRHYSDNIKDAMSDMDVQESSANYINVMINTQFVQIADKNYDNLIRAQKKPYFARIDFIAKGSDKRERFYIGKTSLLREGEFTPLVVDWRAPVANLYYEGRLGENTYESEGDVYVGDLLLKRQIAIENAQLVDFIDVDITTNDAFLQASLEASADKRLKDIASTIQAEQNRVIRANMR
ncbi:MAG TPA: DNA helicase, partial [Fusibacter sp.]|nr:DNA helicase [Fusibacter sp.]